MCLIIEDIHIYAWICLPQMSTGFSKYLYGDDFSEKFDLQEIVDDGNLNHQHQSSIMQQQNKNISLRYLKLFDARPMAMIIRVK